MKLYAASLLLVHLSPVTAIPFAGLYPKTITASENELSSLKLFAEYSGAAYCRNVVNNATATFITCESNGGSCKLVESNKAFIFSSFYEVGHKLTTGFVSIDNSAKLIIVAFRGTPGAVSATFLNNLDIDRDETDICGTQNTHDKCIIHRGYLSSWQEIYPTVHRDLEAAVAAFPGHKIIFTGHSLGGAVASIGAAVMRNAGYSIDLYTYGQPRIGSVDIANYITSQAPSKGINLRVTDWNDFIPDFPFHENSIDEEWDHFSPEYWIAKDGTNIGAADIHVISTLLYSREGNSKFGPLDRSIASHKAYFGRISACH